MADCPYHKEHEFRISQLEEEQKKMKEAIRDPAVAVAIISVLGVCFNATMVLLGVVLGPVIRTYLGV